jgi:SulP family sulfate permease
MPAPLHRLPRPAWWSLLTPEGVRADAWAGLLSAVLVLPQAIAFATLAGLPPQYGLYSAVVPCIVAAVAGSSWHVVTGPTNANSLALAAMLAPLAVAGSPGYVELALALTLLVGLLQLATGVLRLGAIAHFISPTALLGFSSGAALLILWHALPQGLGLPAALFTVDHAAQWARSLADVSPGAVLVCLLTLATAAGLRRWRPRWPFMLAGLLAGTALAALLGWAPGARAGRCSCWGPCHRPCQPCTGPTCPWRAGLRCWAWRPR